MTAPDFLTVQDVELLHSEQLRLFGGLDGVHDRGALESVYEAMIGVSARTVSKDQLAGTLERLAVPYTDP